jgi:hypothetical protein
LSATLEAPPSSEPPMANGRPAVALAAALSWRLASAMLAAHTFHRRTELLRNFGARVSGET